MKKSYNLPEICNVRKQELLNQLQIFLDDYDDIFNENLITPESFERLLHDTLYYNSDEVFYSQNKFGIQNVVSYSVYYTCNLDLTITDSKDIQFPIIKVNRCWVNEKYKDVLPDSRELVIVSPEILKNICMLFLIEGHNSISVDVTVPKEMEKYLDGMHLKAIKKYQCTLDILNSCATQYNLEQMTKK